MSELLPRVPFENDPFFTRVVEAIIQQQFGTDVTVIEYPTLRAVRALASAVVAAIRDEQAIAFSRPPEPGRL